MWYWLWPSCWQLASKPTKDMERSGHLQDLFYGSDRWLADGLTGNEGEWPEGIKDDLGWVVMSFAETTGKG